MSRSRPSTSRPSDIVRRDLDRHISLLTFLGTVVNQHTKELQLYVTWGYRAVDATGDPEFYFDGVQQGILAEFLTREPVSDVEGPEEYIERRAREASEAALASMERM